MIFLEGWATIKHTVHTRTAKLRCNMATAKQKQISKKSNVASTASERYEIRISSERRVQWERAKVISGFSTLKDYLTHLADQDAERVIKKHEKMTLTNDIFDQFVNACENASKPNSALLAAANSAKEQGF